MATRAKREKSADFEVLAKLDKDLKQASRTLGRRDVRYLVDLYYQIQRFRIASGHQAKTSDDQDEPNRLVSWVHENMATIERNIKTSLGKWAAVYNVGMWAQSITGIGPVISAGLLAHLDIRQAPTVGHFWAFAGLDPTKAWEKGKKRPFNARLKTLCAYKLGESFVKTQNKESDFYGQLYAARKRVESERNLALAFKDQAERVLATKRIGKDTDAYKFYSQGMLPPAHVHARSRRWAVKLFLAHLHEVMFRDWHGTEPPKPYIFEHQPPGSDHRHKIEPPNWPMAGGKNLGDMGE